MVVRQLAGKLEMPAQQAFATRLWEHSAHVAALAHLIARRVTGMDPESALFGGILHEIGGFYLLSRVKEFPGLLDGLGEEWTGAGTEDDADEISPENELGCVVLAALSVPQSVTDGIAMLWNGYLTFPPVTLGDTLLLADQLAPVRSPLFKTMTENPIEMDNSLDLIVELDSLSHILNESAAEVKSLTDALRH